ncbi:sigma-70 family RNA polymerase sigma factor [Streptomyces sp. CAU 1734]|uniref:sigma-70 family RNA polymerase sigma factor n=1 Tax=Streptomyces sp. CAU 1734 TaxID=3140360 RepID=UPI003260F547
MSGEGRDARDEPHGGPGGTDGAGGTDPGETVSHQVPGQGGRGSRPSGSHADSGDGADAPEHLVPSQGTGGTLADDSPGFGAGLPVPPPGYQAAGAPENHAVPLQREGSGSASLLPPPRELPTSDAELIQRMRGGDDSAYGELFRRHSGAVRSYARTCCRDTHTADDLTAEVFARTLQAVRGGAGPEHAVRAYLLTTVRRVAASWTRTQKTEQLVDDFAVFAAEAARVPNAATGETLDLGADVRAMHEAEQSLAMQAFRSLPERWQAVLWHTTVEEESPSEVAPLFGLTANATAVLAGRAREGLKQAYLQAHVNAALTSGGDCARYADRLGAYARGGLRMRAELGLRKHLEGCAKCRLAAGELAHVNAGIPALLPIAVIGWFAAGYSLKAAGVVAGGAVGAAGAGAAAAATGGAGSAGSAGAGAASEGLGAPAKAGVAALFTVAAAAGLVWAFTGTGEPEPEPDAKPPAVRSIDPPPSPPAPEPPPKPAPPAPKPVPKPPEKPAPPSAAPSPKPSPPAPKPTPPPSSPAPTSPPAPAPTSARPTPTPSPPPAPEIYQLNRLKYNVFGDHTGPEVRLSASTWLWQRENLSIAGERYAHGVTVHAVSSIVIDLNRACSGYDAKVGVDDLTRGIGSVRFSVYGDGVRLWRSPVVRADEPAVPVHVPLTGRETIRLVVEPVSPYGSAALADWAESRIACG